MSTYLFILSLLFVNFWGLKPFGTISQDMNIMLIMAMLLYGYCKYANTRKAIRIRGRYKYLLWIVVGILISTIPTMIYYNQDITTSLMVYRSQIVLLTIPVLFRIRPTIEEISKALFLFAIAMFIANLIVGINPGLFVFSEEAIMRYELDPENNRLRAISGVSLVIIPLYYYLQKLRTNFNTKLLFKVFFIFLVIYIAENRSTLFPATILTLYSFTKIKSKYKPIILTVLAIVIAIVAFQTIQTWESLILETEENINDEDANRNKALLYFTTIGQPSWITYLFGNGIISAQSSNYTIMLKGNGIFYSDVGFIGYWYNFGIIPIIAMTVMFINILKSKIQTYSIKLMTIHILICAFTISYFFNYKGPILQLIFAYYIYYYNIESTLYKKNQK